MALRTTVTLRGDREYVAALTSLQAPAVDRVYRAALKAAAKEVQERTRTRYLSGQVLRVITGELRRSIEIDSRDLPRAIEIGSKLEQAGPLHFGWRAHGLEPRPFLSPALDSVTPKLADYFVEALEAQTEKARKV